MGKRGESHFRLTKQHVPRSGESQVCGVAAGGGKERGGSQERLQTEASGCSTEEFGLCCAGTG